MEPNEAEKQQASEWAYQFAKDELDRIGLKLDFMTIIGLRVGFAAALAKCRGMVEAERERGTKKLKDLSDEAYVNYLRKCDSELCRGLDFKLSHGEFTKLNFAAHCQASEEFGKHKGFMEAAAAIRKGPQ